MTDEYIYKVGNKITPFLVTYSFVYVLTVNPKRPHALNAPFSTNNINENLSGQPIADQFEISILLPWIYI